MEQLLGRPMGGPPQPIPPSVTGPKAGGLFSPANASPFNASPPSYRANVDSCVKPEASAGVRFDIQPSRESINAVIKKTQMADTFAHSWGGWCRSPSPAAREGILSGK